MMSNLLRQYAPFVKRLVSEFERHFIECQENGVEVGSLMTEMYMDKKKELASIAHQVIPIGCYCYSYDNDDKYQACPFYEHVEDIEGKCSYCEAGNREIEDQVKNCFINDPTLEGKLKPHGGPAEKYPYFAANPDDPTIDWSHYNRQLLREFCDLIAEYGSSNPIEHYQELADNLLAKRRRP